MELRKLRNFKEDSHWKYGEIVTNHGDRLEYHINYMTTRRGGLPAEYEKENFDRDTPYTLLLFRQYPINYRGRYDNLPGSVSAKELKWYNVLGDLILTENRDGFCCRYAANGDICVTRYKKNRREIWFVFN